MHVYVSHLSVLDSPRWMGHMVHERSAKRFEVVRWERCV